MTLSSKAPTFSKISTFPAFSRHSYPEQITFIQLSRGLMALFKVPTVANWYCWDLNPQSFDDFCFISKAENKRGKKCLRLDLNVIFFMKFTGVAPS